MSSGNRPQRGVLEKRNANSAVEHNGPHGRYNAALSRYSAVDTLKARQLRVEAQEAAAELERTQPEPGAAMSANELRRLGNLRSAVDRREARAKFAENEALKYQTQALKEAEKRLRHEKENPEEDAMRIQLWKKAVRAQADAARARDEEAARAQTEAARRARYANWNAAQLEASRARIAAAGQAARARVEAELAQEAAERRVREAAREADRVTAIRTASEAASEAVTPEAMQHRFHALRARERAVPGSVVDMTPSRLEIRLREIQAELKRRPTAENRYSERLYRRALQILDGVGKEDENRDLEETAQAMAQNEARDAFIKENSELSMAAIRQHGRGSYRKKRTFRSKRKTHHARKTHRKRK